MTRPRAATALRAAAPVVALALTAAACSSDSTTEAGPADELPLGTSSTTPVEQTAEAEDDAGPDEAAPTEVEVPTLTPSDGGTTPPPTTGSGLPPVTTSAAPRGGDPQGLYRGVIGALGADQAVANAVVDAPTVEDDTFPLTGLAGPGAVADRPAIVVKIDNGSAAAPHTGLNAADIVVEEEVEGGVTRFAAIFHSTDSIVGPVRSGRTTDVAILGGLGSSLLLYSGANDVTQAILVAQPFIELRAEGWSTGFWRDTARSRPSNLYTDTAPHWAASTGSRPPAQFHFRAPGQSVTTPAASPISELAVAYPASVARWEWDGSAWHRWQRGAEHLLTDGEQVSAANVVVIEADEVDTGLVDASGGVVPEFVFVGSGRAVVFTDGHRIEGTWTRPTLTSVATLTTGAGQPIALTPGRTWIQLVQAGSDAVSSSR